MNPQLVRLYSYPFAYRVGFGLDFISFVQKLRDALSKK